MDYEAMFGEVDSQINQKICQLRKVAKATDKRIELRFYNFHLHGKGSVLPTLVPLPQRNSENICVAFSFHEYEHRRVIAPKILLTPHSIQKVYEGTSEVERRTFGVRRRLRHSKAQLMTVLRRR